MPRIAQPKIWLVSASTISLKRPLITTLRWPDQCRDRPSGAGRSRLSRRRAATSFQLLGQRIGFAARDDPDRAVLPDVIPSPRGQNGQSVSKTDQVVDVDHQPG